MKIIQQEIKIKPKSRGFHLITDEIAQVIELGHMSGLLHLHLQHTSASLTLNENADPTVRDDFESFINHLIPENYSYSHDYEGSDDMPGHIKSSLLGVNVSIPITNGRFNLGTWQGIYLGEHRNRASSRTIIMTFMGE
jgi:secondary thiamine-phosphate synthase enzyme